MKRPSSIYQYIVSTLLRQASSLVLVFSPSLFCELRDKKLIKQLPESLGAMAYF